jgi:hypothetical protein
MNDALVTTGLIPLCIGSIETFQLQPFLDKLPWNLTGGSANLLMTDPNGTNYNFPATIVNGGAQYTWTVIGPAGNWTRAWEVTDAIGITQVSNPIVFSVISSPS